VAILFLLVVCWVQKPDGTLPEDPDLQLSQMFDNVDELLKALGFAKRCSCENHGFYERHVVCCKA